MQALSIFATNTSHDINRTAIRVNKDVLSIIEPKSVNKNHYQAYET